MKPGTRYCCVCQAPFQEQDYRVVCKTCDDVFVRSASRPTPSEWDAICHAEQKIHAARAVDRAWEMRTW